MFAAMKVGFLLACTFVLAGCSGSGSGSTGTEPTDAETKRLISQSASISADTFRRIIARGSANDIEKKRETMPLSLWLLTQDPGEPNEAFSMTRPPNPAKLADALIGGRKPMEDVDYASYIRPDYITRINVTSEAEGLTGVAEFEVTDLYSGRVHFTMKQRDDEWAVTELSMPEKNVAFQCGPKGRWRVIDRQDQQ